MAKIGCVNKEKNLNICPCSYPDCDKKGLLLMIEEVSNKHKQDTDYTDAKTNGNNK